MRAQGLSSLLDSGESLLLRILPEGAAARPVRERAGGALTVVNPCPSGGALRDLPRAGRAGADSGGGGESPIAAALADLALRVGLQVVAGAGEDLTALVVASHGRGEEDALVAALRAGVPYAVGLRPAPSGVRL